MLLAGIQKFVYLKMAQSAKGTTQHRRAVLRELSCYTALRVTGCSWILTFYHNIRG